MIQPNPSVIDFCNWMLNISKQYLSGPQRVIVTDIMNAAIAQVPVSDQDWYNFNLFTAWRNRFYIVYRDYARQPYPPLLNNLLYAWNFESSSNSDFGTNNGTDTNMAYNSPSGKVLNGADLTSVGSQIVFTPWSMGNNTSLSLWARVDVVGSSTANIIMNTVHGQGVRITAGSLFLQFLTTTAFSSGKSIVIGQWFHVVVVVVNSSVFVYLDSVLVLVTPVSTGGWSPSIVGRSDPNNGFQGAFDCLATWTRALSAEEVGQLYNGGAGIQYPF